ALFKKLSSAITAKTTLVCTVVFVLLLIGYAAFVLASIGSLVGSGQEISQDFMRRMIITSAVVVLVFIVLGAVLGGFSSQYMISPVRKITHRVKEISEDNISARLDPVDSQDELMELTKQINTMLDKLQQAFERQENFVSDASHELKTPLAVIAGYANLLRRWGKDDPKVLDEAVNAISRESENMKRIVDQLLWLAKLGDFALNCTTFNLYETVSGVVEGYRLVNTGHQIELSGEQTVTLNTDKNLLTEAVRTLVDNAIKYTPAEKGVIKLFVECVEGGVEIAVQDNGIGISDADCSQIFDRFFRCDKVRGRESGSCGLGLTICKQIVEMMGGKISVESELGRGSTFTIALYSVVEQ
ncbi:MAG: HAMP domain-containing histidine kinase, partial [Clostridiales bacterium]|nr:HAMP domain-containing histidine kinase [Clostridiales bacterium]